MSESLRVGIVILAAGGSTRMGRPKQNLMFRDKTLLQATIDAALSAVQCGVKCGIRVSVFVVLGANENVIRLENDFKSCDVIVNNRWEQGMSSSICCALSHLEYLGRFDAALFTVADLVYVDGAHFVKLIDEYVMSDAPVVCSAYVDKNEVVAAVFGVPALFRRELFAELMALTGDVGAKGVIAKYSNTLVSVKVESASDDIDTEADYARANDSEGEKRQ